MVSLTYRLISRPRLSPGQMICKAVASSQYCCANQNKFIGISLLCSQISHMPSLLPPLRNLLAALIESHANQIRKLNQRHKPNEGGNFVLFFLKEELECHTYRNEIRKIMIYCIAECVHKKTQKKVEPNKGETFLLFFGCVVCRSLLFVVLLGITTMD